LRYHIDYSAAAGVSCRGSRGSFTRRIFHVFVSNFRIWLKTPTSICMAIKIPPSFKLSQLKKLAFQCGVSTSGTKPVLTNRLINEIVPIIPNHGSKILTPSRILSIDMGIRNLAYCILDIPSDIFSNNNSLLPTVTAWRRIAVSSAPVPSEDEETPLPKAKEAFDPQTLSIAAYALLRHTLLPNNPTHILIERQRFRSMGSPHILEWTIRVNMFESMLYAILQTLKSERIWGGTVIPIAPGKVGPFWLEAGQDVAIPSRSHTKLRNTKTAKLLNKGAKIDLVKSWLEGKEKVILGTSDAESTAYGYLEKWHRLPGRTKSKGVVKSDESGEFEAVGKLDDLADSLLQGLAWIQWEKNKRGVLKNGVETLDLPRLNR
jgi:cruciform cutting endonuclease 1